MSKPNAAYSLRSEDCQDELQTAADYIRDPEFVGVRPAKPSDFAEGFALDLERVATLARPFVTALRMARITHNAGDLAGLQTAMGELAEAARAFARIDTIASLAERRIAMQRRRQPRTRP